MNHKTTMQKNIWLICLALILSVLAPTRALALSATSLSSLADCGTESQATEMDCCRTLQECCCSPAPLEPNNLESVAQPGQSTKLIPVKAAARPAFRQWVASGSNQECSKVYSQNLAVMAELPLYLLKRSLLI